uniref:Bacteriophage T5 Orf172 DNA-binding domain-containing protein n=1 Tax=viral metagenome TaxID=1070528 RepID=A0A6C0J2M9_9ZZZZ
MGWIYILRPRSAMAENQSVNKVGITDATNPFTRLNKYEKGSQPLYIVYVNVNGNELKKLEKHILDILENIYIKRKDYGAEYFECDFLNLKQVVDKELLPYMNCINGPSSSCLQNDDEYGKYWDTIEKIYVSPYDNTKYTTVSQFKKHMVQQENAAIKKQQKINKTAFKSGTELLRKQGFISKNTSKILDSFI